MKIVLFTLFLLISSKAYAEYTSNRDAEKDAYQAIITATYKQSGIEDNVNRYVEHLVPQEYKELVGRVAIITRAVVIQRVELKWDF